MPTPGTHFSGITRKKRVLFDAPPAEPLTGDFYFDNLNNRWAVYDTNQWYYAAVSSTTSTSTSTTSTSSSTSTTSTSSSSSTSTSTSTSSSTSTTTTL